MSETQCKGTTKRGKPCRSRHVGEDGYCTHHSPAREEKKRLAKLQEERKLTEQEHLEDKLYDGVGEILRRGDALPPKLQPCGIATWCVVNTIAEKSCNDERTKKLVLAEAEGYRRALTRDYKLTTGLERMLADRIVLAYQRLLYLEAITDVDHAGGINTHEHLDCHRKLVMRESAEFLRNVRMLKDLKTVPLRLMIKDAGQVNVGQQQVKVTDPRQVRQAKEATAEVGDAERSESKAAYGTQTEEDGQ